MVSPLTAEQRNSENAAWPLRGWGLALLGGIVGLGIYLIADEGSHKWTENATRLALASFISTAAIAFAFVVERGRITGSAIFAIMAGLVVASVLYWSGDFSSWEPWRLVSALLTVAIAAPLFQGHRDGMRGGSSHRWHIPYVETHERAWTNVCLWFAVWGFVATVWLLAWLLAALFNLIGIDAIENLLKKSWFAMVLAGAAFGGACGLLRDHERLVQLIQRVVMLVLSVLAPVLAVGLVLFLAALPFTGLDALWETTKSTTPILLTCVIGALILTNAVIGDKAEDEAKLRFMRWSAMALAITILPLGIIAAISTGLRIQQYGLTPERLWAVTFSAIACAYGLAYLVSLARGRETGWTCFARAANLRLAVGLCALAFLLSTPLISFGAISTHNQIARLENGKVSPEKFDYAALRFDFGPAGKKALERLAKQSGVAKIRELAGEMLKSENRYSATETQRQTEVENNIILAPGTVGLPADLRRRLSQYDACGEMKPCNVIYHPADGEVLVVRYNEVKLLTLQGGKWVDRDMRSWDQKEQEAIDKAFAAGRVEIREVKQRQVFVDGEPVGDAFE